VKEVENSIKNFEGDDIAHYTKGFQELSIALFQVVTAAHKCNPSLSVKEVFLMRAMLSAFAAPETIAIKAG
jgi:hypothetical protein